MGKYGNERNMEKLDGKRAGSYHYSWECNMEHGADERTEMVFNSERPRTYENGLDIGCVCMGRIRGDSGGLACT